MATQIQTPMSPDRLTGSSPRPAQAAAEMPVAGHGRYFIVEDVTVSTDDSTPGYRVMTDREIEPFPEAWLAAGEGFETREAADAALVALRSADPSDTADPTR